MHLTQLLTDPLPGEGKKKEKRKEKKEMKTFQYEIIGSSQSKCLVEKC